MPLQEAATLRPAERRVYPRVPLDAPFFVTLRIQDSRQTQALLVDCGRGGVQLALSPEEADVPHLLSAEVRILGLPSMLDPTSAGLPGSISWVSAERCGVRFTPPLTLSEAVLQAFSDSL